MEHHTNKGVAIGTDTVRNMTDNAIFLGITGATLAAFLAINVFMGVPFMERDRPSQVASTPATTTNPTR